MSEEVPSLLALCLKAITSAIIHGEFFTDIFECYGYDHLQDILDLPSDLLDSVVINLPPLALQTLHNVLIDDCMEKFRTPGEIHGRKRGRYDNFNIAWKILFRKRWPEDLRKIDPRKYITTDDSAGIHNSVKGPLDWQQLYWEKHLQNCLDDAAERALLPSFYGRIGELRISNSIINAISHGENMLDECFRLSYHCDRFGCYARCLRLQNVLCAVEICEMLRSCKLQKLIFIRIISKTQVDGVCMLLNHHRKTLLSLEFIHCQLYPTVMNKICSSLCEEGSLIHGIQSFCVKSSPISESKSSLIPTCLLSFLSSGRLLESVCFSDTKMQPKFAKKILDTLLSSSSDLVTLEISENNISGWLSKIERQSKDFRSLLGSDASLKSLTVLNLRGSNLHSNDAEDLGHILVKMPCLKSLDISDNPITDEGIRSLIPYFVRALGKTNLLSNVKLENCNLSSGGVIELLRSLPSLEEPLNMLSIADNHLGSSVAATLAKFLGASGLRELNIEDIGLGAVGFKELEEILPQEIALSFINIRLISQAPNLVSINAGANIMPPESVDIICDALKLLKGKLEHLDLSENSHLCRSNNTSALLEFCHQGKPIVMIPSPPQSGTPYDDDP
ncbi:NACHT, LRR and PYD domains-containing protein 4C-like isoform X2 [Ananas comosus]|uniref:NACHT, LRR and PYD domains-containing protein 4C-like isoform X2 n=1 Tax=Ananas comosus TaxID=4615 RepID=A0A6P5FIT4_ANACO|nr:NACHT, LRR and PYD domains-containing protein 4C-like isoform X2 [Ananas comosus]